MTWKLVHECLNCGAEIEGDAMVDFYMNASENEKMYPDALTRAQNILNPTSNSLHRCNDDELGFTKPKAIRKVSA